MLDLSHLRSLAGAAQTHAGMLDLPVPIRDIVVGSVTHVVLLSAIIVVLALCATLMIPELPMASRAAAPPAEGEPTPGAHL